MNWKDCTTKADQWNWHAQLYAFRRVHLGVPTDERTSPADPTGDWFNEELVRDAAERLQAKRRRRMPSDDGFFTENELAERAEYARPKDIRTGPASSRRCTTAANISLTSSPGPKGDVVSLHQARRNLHQSR